ncbi:hypothetical protein P7D93_19070 [Enterococcus raffinosus]|uniref:hypothetical protein n=1 Tax=Enterococcus raffinosus TaxID=71452 RepID=UPI0028911B55|nr:hypothetical protein [Enterococcus raffinosus]MDT2531965.1 hypothetical protein [Enterococcus raffinosus]
MNKKEKEQMKQLIEMMEENTYVLEDMSQLDFNIYATILFKKVLAMDYTKPFEEF